MERTGLFNVHTVGAAVIRQADLVAAIQRASATRHILFPRTALGGIKRLASGVVQVDIVNLARRDIELPIGVDGGAAVVDQIGAAAGTMLRIKLSPHDQITARIQQCLCARHRFSMAVPVAWQCTHRLLFTIVECSHAKIETLSGGDHGGGNPLCTQGHFIVERGRGNCHLVAINASVADVVQRFCVNQRFPITAEQTLVIDGRCIQAQVIAGNDLAIFVIDSVRINVDLVALDPAAVKIVQRLCVDAHLAAANRTTVADDVGAHVHVITCYDFATLVIDCAGVDVDLFSFYASFVGVIERVRIDPICASSVDRAIIANGLGAQRQIVAAQDITALVIYRVDLQVHHVCATDLTTVEQHAVGRDINFAGTGTDMPGIAHTDPSLGADQHDLVGIHAAQLADINAKLRCSIGGSQWRDLGMGSIDLVGARRHFQFPRPDAGIGLHGARHDFREIRLTAVQAGTFDTDLAALYQIRFQTAVVENRHTSRERAAPGIDKAAAITGNAGRICHHHLSGIAADLNESTQTAGIAGPDFIENDVGTAVDQMRIALNPAALLGGGVGTGVIQNDAFRTDIKALEDIVRYSARTGRLNIDLGPAVSGIENLCLLCHRCLWMGADMGVNCGINYSLGQHRRACHETGCQQQHCGAPRDKRYYTLMDSQCRANPEKPATIILLIHDDSTRDFKTRNAVESPPSDWQWQSDRAWITVCR